uniref:Bromo domain-containing protein n=1 Tax=Opuntia streptacantha TaxID=393608 RepID=A0A7C9E6U7_OPUST
MAEKEIDETTSSNGAAWGTLEELLLACAVNRHGTTCWDSIAYELQKRISHSVFSPHNCKQKYVDLKRRFCDGGAADERENADEELSRMVDELRKLRVEQLKREVQRHDVSIVSLQLRVKRLEEERENALQKVEEPRVGSDLRIEQDGNSMRTGEKAGEPEQSSPEKFDSAENRSLNESNSSSRHKADNKKSSPEKKRESKSKQRKPDPVRPVKEIGSGASQHAELGESVSESKRESGKQSSDVQSSAILSKSKTQRRRFGGGGSSGDDLEAEEVSPANKRISVKPQPLIRFFEILLSHKHGSVFQRRLPSQETEKYRNMVRQHMDLDMVQSRLDKGVYNDCHPKFYRDLLLIFTNAVLFYRKSSAEYLAGRELRKFVTNEVTQVTRKSDKMGSDIETNHLEPLVKKPRSSTTNMVVCRRRSSNSMQALSESMQNKNGNNNVENGRKEEEPKVDRCNSNRRKKEGEAENENEKPAPRERSTLRSGGLRLSSNNNRKIISKEVVNKREKVVTNQKPESSGNKGASFSKKQGAANFLKRMKQNSSSSQEKGKTDDSEEEDKERRQKEKSNAKKGGNLRRNTRKVDVVVSRRNPTRRGEREAATARRADGRPPKRKAAVMSSTPEPRKGGRSSGVDGDEKSKKKPRR